MLIIELPDSCIFGLVTLLISEPLSVETDPKQWGRRVSNPQAQYDVLTKKLRTNFYHLHHAVSVNVLYNTTKIPPITGDDFNRFVYVPVFQNFNER